MAIFVVAVFILTSNFIRAPRCITFNSDHPIDFNAERESAHRQ